MAGRRNRDRWAARLARTGRRLDLPRIVVAASTSMTSDGRGSDACDLAQAGSTSALDEGFQPGDIALHPEIDKAMHQLIRPSMPRPLDGVALFGRRRPRACSHRPMLSGGAPALRAGCSAWSLATPLRLANGLDELPGIARDAGADLRAVLRQVSTPSARPPSTCRPGRTAWPSSPRTHVGHHLDGR